MGMYCCCGNKISRDDFVCDCDWQGWISIYDWPDERKNKEKPFYLPPKDGKYLVRCANGSGDRYEIESNYFSASKTISSSYDLNPVQVHWEGNDEEQPYAWKELEVTK